MGGKDFRPIFGRLPFWIILVTALFFGVRELGIKEGEEKFALSEAKKLKTITRSYLTNIPDNSEHTKIPSGPRVKSLPQGVFEITSSFIAGNYE